MIAGSPGMPGGIMSVEDARAAARDRFRERLQAGEPVGGCSCHDESAERVVGAEHGGPAETVAGVRFRDSGRTYYFRTGFDDLAVGDWVVAETGRGREAGRVVIAPHQVARKALQGELSPILRLMTPEDVERMDALRGKASQAIRSCAAIARSRRLPLKVIAADFAFDGSSVTISYSVPERERAPDANAMREFARETAAELGRRVEVRQVGPRDEARLLGGLGRCGRTLCCSSWLPVFPEISMNMAKTQDLPLNPSKVSGVCGRLLCCLSYENEQYKQMKAMMPRLGQAVQTPGGPGVVVAMQLLKELVTVRLEQGNTEVTLPLSDLGPGERPVAQAAPLPVAVDAVESEPVVSRPSASPRQIPAKQEPAAAVETAADEVPSGEAVAESADGVSAEAGAPGAPAQSPDAPTGSRSGRRRRRRRGGGQGAPQGNPGGEA